MNQIALPFEPDLSPNRLWMMRNVPSGRVLRTIKIKSCDGRVAQVCPWNFVDEKWPWTGRALPLEELKQKWEPRKRR